MIGKVAAVLLFAVVIVEAKSARRHGAPKDRVHLDIKCGAPADLDPSKYYLLNPVDRCCKKHDECKIRIAPRAKDDYTGVTNPHDEDVVLCECEKEFHRCLQLENTIQSRQLCQFYFRTYVKRSCVNYDYARLSGCKVYYKNENEGLMPERCEVYNYNKAQGMKWDLFDLLPCNATFPDLPDNSHIVSYEPVSTTRAPLPTRPSLHPSIPEDDNEESTEQSDPALKKRKLNQRHSRRHPKSNV